MVGAEITWVDPGKLDWTKPATKENPLPPKHVADWIDLSLVGTLDQIKGNPSGGAHGSKYAALARVRYKGEKEHKTWILLIKASLTGNETLDITQHAKSHKSFPQDPTSDQAYDDEQWESYRKLGYTAGSAIFRKPASQTNA